jgi:hypothetical protein
MSFKNIFLEIWYIISVVVVLLVLCEQVTQLSVSRSKNNNVFREAEIRNTVGILNFYLLDLRLSWQSRFLVGLGVVTACEVDTRINISLEYTAFETLVLICKST